MLWSLRIYLRGGDNDDNDNDNNTPSPTKSTGPKEEEKTVWDKIKEWAKEN